MTRCSHSGATAVATSTMRYEGIFGTRISPPQQLSIAHSTMSTPSRSEILKRVIAGSVMVSAPVTLEQRDDRTAAAHDVAVAHDGEPHVTLALDVVGRDEQLVRAQLGGTVQVDGRRRLVRRQRDDALDMTVEAGVDQILRAEDVGLDELERVVLRCRHLLERRGVHHDVDAFERAPQPRLVADVAEKVTDGRIVALVVDLRHLVLL